MSVNYDSFLLLICLVCLLCVKVQPLFRCRFLLWELIRMYMYSHKIGRNTECLNMPCLVCSKNIPSAQILDTTHNKHNVCYNNVLFAIKGFCSQQEPSVNHTKSELKILSFFHNAHIYLQTYRPANRTACIAAYN